MPEFGPLRVRRQRGPRKFRLHKPQWIDPYPHIPGTEPEKRIFEQLVKFGFFFIFQGQVPELTQGVYVTLAIPGYKPDFVIPEYKVIIDPFSPFHHSLPGAAERDANKIALYTALGYTYYHPWAIAPGVFLFDQNHLRRVKGRRRGTFRIKDLGDLRGIRGGAADVLRAIPELWGAKKRKLNEKQQKLALHPGYELGPFLGAGANSVAAANRKRTKPKPLILASGTRRSKKRRPLP